MDSFKITKLLRSTTVVCLIATSPWVQANSNDAKIYKKYARSTVLIQNKGSLGSGALVSRSGYIVTNWHVVRGADRVNVAFKPTDDRKNATKEDLRPARVVKVDQIVDLALVQVDSIPEDIAVIPLGSIDDISVGSDVHAIGHPQGQQWSYTQGIVSQIRSDYKWLQFSATVIQTQTPINPGNSGGPLLDDNGKLVGINSFTQTGTDGLNFAVGVDEVKRFLAASGSRFANASPPPVSGGGSCATREIYRGPNQDKTHFIVQYDTNCDGKADKVVLTPKDKRKPTEAFIDSNSDGKWDIILRDFDHDGKWDKSFRDANLDGDYDQECDHADGTMTPTRCYPWTGKTFH